MRGDLPRFKAYAAPLAYYYSPIRAYSKWGGRMAQKDRTTLLANLATTYPNNVLGEISPADIRGQQEDVIDSVLNFLSDPPTVPMAASVSFADQDPSGLDVPLKIIYSGSDVNSPGGEVTIKANGDVEFNEDGYYPFGITLTLGRSTNNGVARLLIWLEADGSPIGGSLSYTLDGANNQITLQFQATPFISAGTVITTWVARNSENSGVDDGGVHTDSASATLSGLGVPDVPSAVMNVSKLPS